jgi:hypothetical protein
VAGECGSDARLRVIVNAGDGNAGGERGGAVGAGEDGDAGGGRGGEEG